MNNVKCWQLENKNQFVIKTEEGYYFQSYNSVVAFWRFAPNNQPRLVLGRDWDYSNTTRKHLYIFIDEYTSIYLENNGNKRKQLQKMIDEGVVVYSEVMC